MHVRVDDGASFSPVDGSRQPESRNEKSRGCVLSEVGGRLGPFTGSGFPSDGLLCSLETRGQTVSDLPGRPGSVANLEGPPEPVNSSPSFAELVLRPGAWGYPHC